MSSFFQGFNTHYTYPLIQENHITNIRKWIYLRKMLNRNHNKRCKIFLNQRNFLANFVMHPSSTKELSKFTIKNCMKSERKKLKNIPFVIKHSLRLTNFKYTPDNITNFLHVKSASKVSKI